MPGHSLLRPRLQTACQNCQLNCLRLMCFHQGSQTNCQTSTKNSKCPLDNKSQWSHLVQKWLCGCYRLFSHQLFHTDDFLRVTCMRPSASGSTERAVSPMAFGFKRAAFARVGSKSHFAGNWSMRMSHDIIYILYIYTYNYTYISCIYADFMWFPGICNRLPIAFLCKMPPNIPMCLLDNAFGAWVLGSDHRSIHVTKTKNCWVASDPATVTTQILPFRYKELCPWNSAGTKLPLNNPHSNLSPGTVSSCQCWMAVHQSCARGNGHLIDPVAWKTTFLATVHGFWYHNCRAVVPKKTRLCFKKNANPTEPRDLLGVSSSSTSPSTFKGLGPSSPASWLSWKAPGPSESLNSSCPSWVVSPIESPLRSNGRL